MKSRRSIARPAQLRMALSLDGLLLGCVPCDGVIQRLEGRSKASIREYSFRVSTRDQLAGLTEMPIPWNVRVGGAIRWEDKATISDYDRLYAALGASNPPITKFDPHHPIPDQARPYCAAFVGYRASFGPKRSAPTSSRTSAISRKMAACRPSAPFPTAAGPARIALSTRSRLSSARRST